jgi:serine protease AprX
MGDSKEHFNKEDLWSTVIAIPLIEEFHKYDEGHPHPVVIDLNLDCGGGRRAAKKKTLRLLEEIMGKAPRDAAIKDVGDIPQYLFATLTADHIRQLVTRDYQEELQDDDLEEARRDEDQTSPAADAPPQKQVWVRVDVGDRVARNERAIYRVWPDFEIELQITKSISTVKADAAQRSFFAHGAGVVWAVLDSGIEKHPHFTKHGNLDLALPVAHQDFTGKKQPHTDSQGHGTHVAGILAGELATTPGERVVAIVSDYLDENRGRRKMIESIPSISGVAPQCKVVSLRVVAEDGGNVSNIIAALTYVQEINGYGRRLLIHGVNMSLGYNFDPKWFACGHSPLCVEVDRLVRSGVVVVIAAGNNGYINKVSALDRQSFAAGESLTIKDPGNSELAITVGSTHREMPHMYGVSYFSSKGPTGDGRLKPDLLAPGEKILSCAAGTKKPAANETEVFRKESLAVHGTDNIAWYVQESGTSMAAPHVSGAIAAFLSIRREFIGRPEEVKRIFTQAATDLGRERYFQGSGLVDLMRAIQSV